jgi:hypothetical protein
VRRLLLGEFGVSFTQALSTCHFASSVVPAGCVGVGVGVGVFLEQLAKIKTTAKMGKDIFILPSYNIANKRAVELATDVRVCSLVISSNELIRASSWLAATLFASV